MNHSYTSIGGNLTRDPEVKFTSDGKGITKFSVAVNNPYNKEKTSFYNVVAFDSGNRKLSEIIGNNFRKGDNIFVEGRMEQSHWEDSDGNKRNNWDLILNNFCFTQKKAKSNNSNETNPF